MSRNGLIEAIKTASIQANLSMKPTNITIGTVENINPYKIRINQKILLGQEFLIFSEKVLGGKTSSALEDLEVEHSHGSSDFNSQTAHSHINDDGTTVSEETIQTSHSHPAYKMKFNLKHSHNSGGLEVGDKVILISDFGGQKYFVIDKVIDV